MTGRSNRTTRKPGPWRTDQPPPKGNKFALKHGAHSPRSWQPIAEELAAGIVADCPWLDRPAFRAAVWSWAVVEAQAELVDRWLAEHGWTTGEGTADALPRPALALADRLHGRAMQLRSQLGLDPTSMAKLLDGVGDSAAGFVDVEALAAEGRAVLAQRTDLPPGLRALGAPQAAADGPEPAT